MTKMVPTDDGELISAIHREFVEVFSETMCRQFVYVFRKVIYRDLVGFLNEAMV